MTDMLLFCSQVNSPELDLCEDLSQLVSVNESSVLHTLTSRAKAHMALTHTGANLLALWPPLAPPGKVEFTLTVHHPVNDLTFVLTENPIFFFVLMKKVNIYAYN